MWFGMTGDTCGQVMLGYIRMTQMMWVKRAVLGMVAAAALDWALLA